MGQHKYNPNCQLAREGKLPPKPKKMSKREEERLLYAKCAEILYRPLIKAYVKMQTQEENTCHMSSRTEVDNG